MVVLYLQLYQNRMVVRNLNTRQQASSNQNFSNQRILVADFFPAERLLHELIQQVAPRKVWHSLPGCGRMAILAHALEMNEGGLSPVEERAILEMTYGAARRKCHEPKVVAGPTALSDQQVLVALGLAKNSTPTNNNRPTIVS